MAERVLLIKLKTTAEGQPVIAGMGRTLDDLAKSENRLQREMKETTSASNDQSTALGRQVSSLKNLLGTMAGVAGVGMLVRGMAQMVKTGLEYNAAMEQSKLGLAAIVAGVGRIRDEHGKLVEGAAKFAISQQIAIDMQRQLKTEALKTTASYSDLVRVMQDGLGPALQAGISDSKQIVQLVTRVAQAGGALGIAGDRLGQEIRALLQGEKGPDNQIANFIFAGVDNAKKKIEELRASGKLFDFLMERMKSFGDAGEEMGNTLNGALSNLKDAWEQALGEATQGETSRITLLVRDLTAQIVTFDAAGRATFNQDFVDGIESIAAGITSMGSAAVAAVTHIGEMVDWLHALDDFVLGKEGTTFGQRMNRFNPFREMTEEDRGGLDYLFRQRQEDRRLRQMARQQRTDPDAALREAAESGTSLGAASFEYLTRRPRMSTDPPKPPPAGQTAAQRAAEKRRSELQALHEYTSNLSVDAEREARDRRINMIDDEIERERQARQAAADDWLAGKKASISKEVAATEEGKKEIAALEAEHRRRMTVADDDAMMSSLERVNKRTLEETRALHELTTGLAIDGQRRTRDGRIALIQDEVERERQERRASSDDWLADQMAQIEKQYTIESERQKAVAAVQEEYRQRNDAADAEAIRKINERTVGTAEYWKKLGEAVRQQFRGIAQIVGDTILESRATLASGINGMLDDMAEGQLDLGASLKGLISGLGSIWRKNLTDILMNGQNIAKQIKTMFDGIYKPVMGGPNGEWEVGTDWMGTALGGAGFGSMLGGFFQKPGNYAGEGGAIGGGVGAVAGAALASVFTGGMGAALGAKIGAMVGTVLGTLVGSMIQKGEDFIRVRMSGITAANANAPGTATWFRNDKGAGTRIDLGNGAFFEIEDRGIDAAARTRLATQIRRRIKEELKAWQSVLDLFPQYVRDELAKMQAPQLNLTGEVVNADITDDGAMGALGSFLTDRLPEAAFKAYSEQIRRAFELMGVGDGRIEQLFRHWGELQGKELQDAVRGYVTTLVETIDLRDKMMQPFETRWAEAQRQSSMTALGQIDELDAQLATAVASMAKLTDIDDLVAAQQHVNQLAAQRYDMEIQYLQRIQAVQQQISQSIAQQKEQISMAGMDDQGKIDFVWQRMREIRTQLALATNPEDVSRLTQQMQQYVAQAFSFQGDNAEVRGKLLGILSDVDQVAKTQLEKARKELEERDLKPATALQTAAEMLMKAADDLAGGARGRRRPQQPPDRPARPNLPGDDRPPGTPRHRMEALSAAEIAGAVEEGVMRAFSRGRLPIDLRWSGRMENTGELLTSSVQASVGTILRILQNDPDASVSRTAPRRAR